MGDRTGWRFGMVGTAGALRAGRGRGRENEDEVAVGFGGDVINGWAGSRDDFEGDSPSSRFFLNFWDDFRGGGLGGSGDSLFFFLLSFLSFLSPSRTVELDDDEVKDSLTAARPWVWALTESMSFDMLPVLLRLRGGLVWVVWVACSICRILATDVGIRMGATSPGDCDDIDVGVVSRLYGPGPGDPENLVEGLPLKTLELIWLLAPENNGVGGGRS